jgi:putative nucleotidyltransferase with HDIG domain
MDIARDVRVVRFLPAYFNAISHLLALLSQEEPPLTEIVQAVGTDQSLTSRLLTVVNSPVYGTMRQIGSINEAVVRIGLVGLRNLVLAVSMNDITGGGKREEWRHSINVAYLADLLAKRAGPGGDVPRFAFVAGLMHDIGKLFLTRRYMLDYQTVVKKVNFGANLTDAEKSIFGYDHAAVGSMLLTAWNVPERIVDAIKVHHEPGENRLAVVIFNSNQVTCWKAHPETAPASLEVMGLAQAEIERLYTEALIKSHDMESKIH